MPKIKDEDAARQAASDLFREKFRRVLAGMRPVVSVNFRTVVACRQLGRRIAEAYAAAPLIESRAVPAYRALWEETARQFDLLTGIPKHGGLGIEVEVTVQDPYVEVGQLLADLDTGRLRVWSTAACGNRHPLLSDDENDMFRAVHDAFGHGATRRGFDVHGEEAAWLLHSRMYSLAARPALTTETRGQNCALVFGGDGRQFPLQKAVLLDRLFADERTVHVAPCGGRCVP